MVGDVTWELISSIFRVLINKKSIFRVLIEALRLLLVDGKGKIVEHGLCKISRHKSINSIRMRYIFNDN